MTQTQQEPTEGRGNPLFSLLELARTARRAETAPALQFMLVNQTHRLCPYVLAAFWVEGEGIVAQSGVTNVDRNAPFIQWLAHIFSQLDQHDQPTRVTTDLLAAEDVTEWGAALPPAALWLPLRNNDAEHAGLLLCRQEPWQDADMALLVEWLDIWSHAWHKMHAPSMHGEFARAWQRLRGNLPDRDQLQQELLAVKNGARHVTQETLTQPTRWPAALKALCISLTQPLRRLVQEGPQASLARLKAEVRAIWHDKRRRLRWLLLLVLAFPVRLSILAPAELVPAHPAIIRVPIEGVVDEFFVSPNQVVAEGQPLFKLDLTTLSSRLNVAQQETQIAASEYRQSALQSLTDARSRTQLVPQEGKAAQRKVEADYLQELLAKAQIKSPRAGIVLFDDPSEWIGKPVTAGEKVMVVATEGDVEIEAWVPVGDAIALPAEAPVTLYLNASPLSPVNGHLRYIGHEALQRPDGSYAYRLRASLNPGEHGPRVGLKGTAKISGQFVPLVYWALRKPLGTVRQFLGV